jgi:hypothetical protein
VLQKDRQKLFDFLLSDCELIEGSYQESLLRCGRTGCHCEKEGGHLVGRISRWQKGKLKNKVVRVADRERIRKLVADDKAHKKALNQIKKIDDRQKRFLKNVIHLKSMNYI